jgi:hypothetical protein
MFTFSKLLSALAAADHIFPRSVKVCRHCKPTDWIFPRPERLVLGQFEQEEDHESHV